MSLRRLPTLLVLLLTCLTLRECDTSWASWHHVSQRLTVVIDPETPVTPDEMRAAQEIDVWNYAYSLAAVRNGETWWAEHIANQVVDCAKLYHLDPYLVARIIWVESRCWPWARSAYVDKNGNYVRDKRGQVIPIGWGLMQIHLAVNWNLLLRVRNGELRGKVVDAKTAETVIYAPFFNVAAGCLLLRDYLDRFDHVGDDRRRLEMALMAFYAGPSSQEFRDYAEKGKKFHYLEETLNPVLLENNAHLYYNYHFIRKRVWVREQTVTNVVRVAGG